MIVSNRYFKVFVTVAILGNAVVQCSDHAGISKENERNLWAADFAFTLLFILELGLKLWAKGWRSFTIKIQNKCDLAIALVQVSVIAYEVITGQNVLLAGNTPVRVLKTTKIVRLVPQLQHIIDQISLHCSHLQDNQYPNKVLSYHPLKDLDIGGPLALPSICGNALRP
jgi:hypothetical protein